MSVKSWSALSPFLWKGIGTYLNPRDAIAVKETAKFGRVTFEGFYRSYFQSPFFKVYREQVEISFPKAKDGLYAQKLHFIFSSVMKDACDVGGGAGYLDSTVGDYLADLHKVASGAETYNNVFHKRHLKESQTQELEVYDASGKGLTRIPTPLFCCMQLTTLQLAGNKLSWLPDEVYSLSTLTYLDVAGNRLTFLSSKIAQLTSLEMLDLSKNQLATLPEELDMENLMGLSLTGNPLVTIPKKLSSAKNHVVTIALRNFKPAKGTQVGCIIS